MGIQGLNTLLKKVAGRPLTLRQWLSAPGPSGVWVDTLNLVMSDEFYSGEWAASHAHNASTLGFLAQLEALFAPFLSAGCTVHLVQPPHPQVIREPAPDYRPKMGLDRELELSWTLEELVCGAATRAGAQEAGGHRELPPDGCLCNGLPPNATVGTPASLEVDPRAYLREAAALRFRNSGCAAVYLTLMGCLGALRDRHPDQIVYESSEQAGSIWGTIAEACTQQGGERRLAISGNSGLLLLPGMHCLRCDELVRAARNAVRGPPGQAERFTDLVVVRDASEIHRNVFGEGRGPAIPLFALLARGEVVHSEEDRAVVDKVCRILSEGIKQGTLSGYFLGREERAQALQEVPAGIAPSVAGHYRRGGPGQDQFGQFPAVDTRAISEDIRKPSDGFPVVIERLKRLAFLLRCLRDPGQPIQPVLEIAEAALQGKGWHARSLTTLEARHFCWLLLNSYKSLRQPVPPALEEILERFSARAAAEGVENAEAQQTSSSALAAVDFQGTAWPPERAEKTQALCKVFCSSGTVGFLGETSLQFKLEPGRCGLASLYPSDDVLFLPLLSLIHTKIYPGFTSRSIVASWSPDLGLSSVRPELRAGLFGGSLSRMEFWDRQWASRNRRTTQLPRVLGMLSLEPVDLNGAAYRSSRRALGQRGLQRLPAGLLTHERTAVVETDADQAEQAEDLLEIQPAHVLEECGLERVCPLVDAALEGRDAGAEERETLAQLAACFEEILYAYRFGKQARSAILALLLRVASSDEFNGLEALFAFLGRGERWEELPVATEKSSSTADDPQAEQAGGEGGDADEQVEGQAGTTQRGAPLSLSKPAPGRLMACVSILFGIVCGVHANTLLSLGAGLSKGARDMCTELLLSREDIEILAVAPLVSASRLAEGELGRSLCYAPRRGVTSGGGRGGPQRTSPEKASLQAVYFAAAARDFFSRALKLCALWGLAPIPYRLMIAPVADAEVFLGLLTEWAPEVGVAGEGAAARGREGDREDTQGEIFHLAALVRQTLGQAAGE